MITNIDITKISGHPDNPRKDLGDLAELAASIKETGILQNLTVVPQIDGEGYIAVIGHRRLAAAKLAGLTEVPCVIADMDMKTQVSTMILENMQRRELTMGEQVDGFQTLLNLGETISDISQKTGLSQSTVRRRTKLSELERDKFDLAVERGGTLLDFAELDKISDPQIKNKLLDKIGTPNFNYSLQSAIDEEKKAVSVAALIEVLDTFAKRVESSEGLQSVRYINKSANMVFEKPDDADDKQYYYIEFFYNFQLFIKKEQVSTPQNPYDAERQKMDSLRSQFDEVSKRAFQLRMEFVKSYSAAKAKKNLHTIIEFSVKNAIRNGYAEMDDKMLLDMLDIELIEDEEFSFDTISQAFALSPERILLFTTYCTDADDHYWSYRNYQCGYKKNPNLDAVYEFLVKLGYEISDEERTLADGTHELYVIEEQVEEV